MRQDRYVTGHPIWTHGEKSIFRDYDGIWKVGPYLPKYEYDPTDKAVIMIDEFEDGLCPHSYRQAGNQFEPRKWRFKSQDDNWIDAEIDGIKGNLGYKLQILNSNEKKINKLAHGRDIPTGTSKANLISIICNLIRNGSCVQRTHH